ncbi:MAG: hypothetical protein N3D76_10740 [Geminocystis sp.]|nr:hypothetical protein [Geminocystis sp.]
MKTYQLSISSDNRNAHILDGTRGVIGTVSASEMPGNIKYPL